VPVVHKFFCAEHDARICVTYQDFK